MSLRGMQYWSDVCLQLVQIRQALTSLTILLRSSGVFFMNPSVQSVNLDPDLVSPAWVIHV